MQTTHFIRSAGGRSQTADYNAGDNANPPPYYNGSGIKINYFLPTSQSDHIWHSDHIIVEYNTIHDCPGGGVQVLGGDFITINHNKIYNCNWFNDGAQSGISTYESINCDAMPDNTIYHNIITGNLIYNCRNQIPWYSKGGLSDGEGIIVDDNELSQTNSSIHGQHFVGKTLVQDNSCVFCGGNGIEVNISQNVDILNNTTWHNNQSFNNKKRPSHAEIMCLSADTVNIQKNICVAEDQDKEWVNELDGSPTTVAWDSNLLYPEIDVQTPGTNPSYDQPTFVQEPVEPATSAAWQEFSGDFNLLLTPQSKGKGWGILSFEVPQLVSGLTASPGNHSVTLAWSASTGATGYNVKRSATSTGVYKTIKSSISATMYLDRTTANGTQYFYEVSAVNGGGESDNSDPVSATPEQAKLTIPLAPSNLVAVAGDRTVKLSWHLSAGATSYNIKRSKEANSGYTIWAINVTAATYSDGAVTNGTKYYYVVSAVNSAGESANSAGVSATPEPPAPAAPTKVVAIAGNGSVALNWNPVSGATGYNVKRSTNASQGFSNLAKNISPNNYNDSVVKNGVTYYYEISAVNGGVEGPNSSPTTATPNPGLLVNPEAFAQWLIHNKLPLSTPLTATPNADGLSVLMKYALSLPVGTSAPNSTTLGVAGDRLTITFNREDPAPVNYIVEGSATLTDWREIATLAPASSTWVWPSDTASITETTSATGVKTVTLTDTYSISHNPRRFLRVRVTP